MTIIFKNIVLQNVKFVIMLKLYYMSLFVVLLP